MELTPSNQRAACPAAEKAAWKHTGPALISKDSLQHRCPVNGGGPFIVPILQMGEAEVWACTLAPSQLAK